jgi:hypothetical protein
VIESGKEQVLEYFSAWTGDAEVKAAKPFGDDDRKFAIGV